MSKRRFIKKLSEGSNFGTMRQIWVDKQTGVNYLYVQAGYSGGLTPLLNSDGKPLVTAVDEDAGNGDKGECEDEGNS